MDFWSIIRKWLRLKENVNDKENYEKIVEEAIEDVSKSTTIIIPSSIDSLKYLPRKYREKIYPQKIHE